jgi:hypothetical protein
MTAEKIELTETLGKRLSGAAAISPTLTGFPIASIPHFK